MRRLKIRRGLSRCVLRWTPALRQPAEGHRCGTDAVLLAAAVPGDYSGLAIDAGAGVGGAGLAVAVARPGVRMGLLEYDPLLAGLAHENLLQNRLTDRGYVVAADLLSEASRRAAGLMDESAGLVISNPPFLDPGRARLSPDLRKRRAHAMPAEGPEALAAWIAAALALVAPGGQIILIHRPDALPAILESRAGRGGNHGPARLFPAEGQRGAGSCAWEERQPGSACDCAGARSS